MICISFNPSYSGCWFGRADLLRLRRNRYYVSILLILDVDSEGDVLIIRNPEAVGFNPSYSGCWFGSLRYVGIMANNTDGFQSFLFWMLIRKLEYEFSLTEKTLCFNPSYSGCWFGRYIVKVACRRYYFGFNPSYSGCWFGRHNFCRIVTSTSGFQSFLFWMLIRKAARRNNNPTAWWVSILLILDVDSEE